MHFHPINSNISNLSSQQNHSNSSNNSNSFSESEHLNSCNTSNNSFPRSCGQRKPDNIASPASLIPNRGSYDEQISDGKNLSYNTKISRNDHGNFPDVVSTIETQQLSRLKMYNELRLKESREKSKIREPPLNCTLKYGSINKFPSTVSKLQERMKSNVANIFGGQKGAIKSWIIKCTSKVPGPPEEKFVRKIILALWEESLHPSKLLQYMSQRPIYSNPVVALKVLITILKALQQGPVWFLNATSVLYIEFFECLSRTWSVYSSKLTDRHVILSNKFSQLSVDIRSVDAVSRFSLLVVQKLRFHQSHPDFNTHFISVPVLLDYQLIPLTKTSSDINALSDF